MEIEKFPEEVKFRLRLKKSVQIGRGKVRETIYWELLKTGWGEGGRYREGGDGGGGVWRRKREMAE